MTTISPVLSTIAEPVPATADRRLESFDEVYHTRYKPMMRLASNMVDGETEAEDIVQESFHLLWQRWESVDTPSSYLRISVVNACNDELRRRRVRRAKWQQMIEEERPDPESEYLTDALARIGERRRTALVLRYYGDRTMNEIAEAMDVPTGTAKSLIHRGLADLRGTIQ